MVKNYIIISTVEKNVNTLKIITVIGHYLLTSCENKKLKKFRQQQYYRIQTHDKSLGFKWCCKLCYYARWY